MSVIKAIVLKNSTFKRVKTLLRRCGFLEDFSLLVSRVSHDSAGVYLYFDNFHHLCSASTYLSALNAVYRVTEFVC